MSIILHKQDTFVCLKWTLSSVANATFVHVTTSEMRTPHYVLYKLDHIC